MDKSELIKVAIASMKMGTDAYFSGALEVWSLLSPEEQHHLSLIAYRRLPIYRTEDGKEIREKLLQHKLITHSHYLDNEGYFVVTFDGAAVVRAGNPNPQRVTLPGEKK